MSIISQFQSARQWIVQYQWNEISFEVFVWGLGTVVDAWRLEGHPCWQSLQTVWNGLEQLNAVLLDKGIVPNANDRQTILDRVDEFCGILSEALGDEMHAIRESVSACDPLVWAEFDSRCRKLVREETDAIPMYDIRNTALKSGVAENIVGDALAVEIADLADREMADVGEYRHGFTAWKLPVDAKGIYVRDLYANEPQRSLFEVFVTPLTSTETVVSSDG